MTLFMIGTIATHARPTRDMIVIDKNGVENFNFGKNKGKAVEDVLKEQPGYYGWIMNNDFPLYTKKVLTEIKLRNFNK